MPEAVKSSDTPAEAPETPQEVVAPRGYVVDPRFRPRPQDRIGSLRTDGVGIPGRDVTSISSAFKIARRRSLLAAAQSLTNSAVVASYQVNVDKPEQSSGVLRRVSAELKDVEHDITFSDQIAVRTTRMPFPPIDIPALSDELADKAESTEVEDPYE